MLLKDKKLLERIIRINVLLIIYCLILSYEKVRPEILSGLFSFKIYKLFAIDLR